MRRETWTWATEGDRGYGKLGDGKRTEKATAKSGEVGGNSCGVVWASDTESWAMRGLVRGEEDEGAKAEEEEEVMVTR